MSGVDSSLASVLTSEHRRLDELLGRFLAAGAAQDAASARLAFETFDRELRRHTGAEEDRFFPRRKREKLIASEEEGRSERLLRELALEHVQIREVSGMILRLLTEKEDLSSARRLIGNLLSRWEAHTTREERELFPAGSPEA